MARGHPDYLTWAGRSAGGETMTSYSFSGAIAGDSSGTIDLPIVAVGTEVVYQNITVSCNDDTAIHNVALIRLSDAWLFFSVNFVTGGIFDFPGQSFGAGTTVRLTITNYSAGALTFEGAVNYTTRAV